MWMNCESTVRRNGAPLHFMGKLRVDIVYVGVLLMCYVGQASTVQECRSVSTPRSSALVTNYSVDEQLSECRYYITAPSEKQVVLLNFTMLQGLHTASSSTPSGQCMPCLTLVDVMVSGQERVINRFCGSGGVDTVPVVFQSISYNVVLIYNWKQVEYTKQPAAGFNCSVSFHHRAPSECAFRCVSDQSCLPMSNLVCNESPDCDDASDERGCLANTSPRPNKQQISPVAPRYAGSTNNALIATVLGVCVIIVATMFFALYLICFRDPQPYVVHRSSDDPRSSSSNEVAYCAVDAAAEREAQRARERHLLLRSAQRSTLLNLPPAIHKSADGEEGYCSRPLPVATDDQHSLLVPPNRTLGTNSHV